MLILRTLAAAAVATFAFSGGALAADPAALLPSGWSHAEINVTGPNGTPHTLIYDRGRVQSVTSSSITLKERDGSVVTIQVAPAAAVRVNGQRGSLAQILPGYHALTLGVDGRPAKQVRATAPPTLQKRGYRTSTA
jgi:hypothetical protein